MFVCCHVTTLAALTPLSRPTTNAAASPSLQMAPKARANTRLGMVRASPDPRKRQASNADQQPTKRTRRMANDPNDDDRDDEEQEEGQEEVKPKEEVAVEPPLPRGGKRGHGVKVSPPTKVRRARSMVIVPDSHCFTPISNANHVFAGKIPPQPRPSPR